MDEQNENRLLKFLKENYPAVIRDNEIKWDELKTALGLPIDERTNGYGLNFIGRNVAKAKYAQKTAKELRINNELSKNFDTTQNIVLKGDNLDCLKILKSYYNGKIKCIYIDPPYNTQSDEFVYPDKFDAEEREVLGLANLNEDDIARMEFSFGNKRSHNGWLSFMYPRLMLASDLLSNDGVIFISIDDNEQANLKLLCDEIFGEENFVADIAWRKKAGGANDSADIAVEHENVLTYKKGINGIGKIPLGEDRLKQYKHEDEKVSTHGKYTTKDLNDKSLQDSSGLHFDITCPDGSLLKGTENQWKCNKETFYNRLNDNRIVFVQNQIGEWKCHYKIYLNEEKGELKYDDEGNTIQKGRNLSSVILDVLNRNGSNEIKSLFNCYPFSYPKPSELIKKFVACGSCKQSIILDFFAGSGTTGHAIMQLNAEDGGNRKFILCQIDEPIDEKKKKEAFDFCTNNNLPPVISSITIERLRRAGEKIKKEIEEENNKAGIFPENKKAIPDIGFKVFDTIDAPKLTLEDEQIMIFGNSEQHPIDRIYNMIFKVGLDNPTIPPKEIVKDCMYRTEDTGSYYITNATELDKSTVRVENFQPLQDAIKSGGKIFIDGWTASINTALQQYKEDIKLVF